MTTKYQPLFDLHQLVQLTHSTTGKTIFYSEVHLANDDNVDEDEAGGWVLSAFTGKTYFEREYRREDLDDLLVATGDKDWVSFAQRFKRAIIDGYFHIMDMSARECKVIVDNEVHSRTGNTTNKLETIEIDMYPVSHANRGEKIGAFMFECASYFQARGCSLNARNSGSGSNSVSSSKSTTTASTGDNTSGGQDKSYDDLKLERDSLKTENQELKKEVQRLHAITLKSASMASGGLGPASGRPKSKNAQMAMMVKEQLLKKRKGVSALNPRMKKGVVAKGTEFGSDDEEDEDE
ncbi:hypothetical protein BGZ51_008644 [Haplosporangium sp. Z 767]|nr:hypothetical protein BGZ50_003544 [Haplosporangium sp. Z 11]KAF9190458.1 hypothetical protein BGZ51_008644 [Haplosporangium sp. Z 767]